MSVRRAGAATAAGRGGWPTGAISHLNSNKETSSQVQNCGGADPQLAFFGSVLRDDFRPDSDVDVLVECEPDASVGFLRLAAMENDLSKMLRRRVDLRTLPELSRYFRKEVLRTAKVQYAQGCRRSPTPHARWGE